MTVPKITVISSAVVIVATLAGCAVSRRQPFRMTFLPPAGAAASAVEITEPPPAIPPDYFSRETPLALAPDSDAPPGSAQTEDRLRRAEQHFQSGKRLLQQGEAEAARVEFDRAIDVLLSTADGAPDRQRMEKRFEELVDLIHRYDVEALGAGEPERLLTFEKSPLDEILELTFPIDPRLKDKVREEAQATVSQLPLQVTDPVLSYINFFSTERGRRTILAGLRRSGRYRPLISRILDEEGIPQELIFLAQAESGFMPRAVSRKAATGMWQFVLFRGREYGLYQSPYNDDRLDPELATRAAARHLRDLYQQFGDWYLAMAAYNCGPMTVERAIQRTGYADFWELRSRGVLPKETANYVPAILAMVIIVKNAGDYGLKNDDPDPPMEYDTLRLTSPTHLALIADVTDEPISLIRELNPALLRNLAPAGYGLHVPKGKASFVTAALDMVPENRRNSWRVHRVGDGETLAVIAKRYSSSVASIQLANKTAPDPPQPGDLLVVPATPAPEPRSLARRPAKRPASTASRRPTTRTAPRASSAGKPTTSVRVAQAKPKASSSARR